MSGIGSEIKQRGVAFDGFRSDVSSQEFEALAEFGTTHVCFTVWGYMRDPHEPAVVRSRRQERGRTSADDRLQEIAALARAAGLETFFVPTIADFRGVTRSDIAMDTEADWSVWFRQYEAFLTQAADLAALAGAAGLAVGMELGGTVGRGEQWRQLTAAVRTRFGGWLTYAANWDDYEAVEWWETMDYVGVQAYFELGAAPPGERGEPRQRFLRKSWIAIRDRLEDVNKRSGRPVLFTEIGYPSRTHGTSRPWSWRETGSAEPELQADAYAAAFQTFWSQPWFAGMYWWKWYASDRLNGRDWSRDYTPQSKPAQRILQDWYRRKS